MIWTAATSLIWNFSFGLYPNHRYSFHNDEVQVCFIEAHPNDVFIVNEQTVLSQNIYRTGRSSENMIYHTSEIKNINGFLNKL